MLKKLCLNYRLLGFEAECCELGRHMYHYCRCSEQLVKIQMFCLIMRWFVESPTLSEIINLSAFNFAAQAELIWQRL
jgi:hypothetical protein